MKITFLKNSTAKDIILVKFFSLPGCPLYFYPSVPHCVLPAAGRNYSPNFIGRAFAGQVPALHDDSRDAFHLRHSRSTEHSFQVT